MWDRQIFIVSFAHKGSVWNQVESKIPIFYDSLLYKVSFSQELCHVQADMWVKGAG